jgi:hypothetical protein
MTWRVTDWPGHVAARVPLARIRRARGDAFLLMLRPRSGAQQWVAREQYVLLPSVPVAEFTVPFGNLCQRLVASPGPLTIRTWSDIEAADAVDVAPGAPFVELQYVPDETLPFLLRVGTANPIVLRRWRHHSEPGGRPGTTSARPGRRSDSARWRS